MKQILGIDVGGTKIAAGLVDTKFRVSNVTVIPTLHTDLLGQTRRLIADYKGFSGIGLGMPGQVLADGVVKSLGNVPWKSINLKQEFISKFRVPVSVMNDTKAFAMAQALVGEGKNFKTVAGVILGTGIGVGFISDKKVYFGANRLAGEIGHFEMPNGKFFEQEVREAGPFKNAKQAHRFLRSLLTFIVRSFDPEIIIVGGGWGGLPGMQTELEYIIKNLKKFPIKTKVKVSKLKHSGIIGAALPLFRVR